MVIIAKYSRILSRSFTSLFMSESSLSFSVLVLCLSVLVSKLQQLFLF